MNEIRIRDARDEDGDALIALILLIGNKHNKQRCVVSHPLRCIRVV